MGCSKALAARFFVGGWASPNSHKEIRIVSDNRVNQLMAVTRWTVRAFLLVAFSLTIAILPGSAAAASASGPSPSPVPFIQSISPVSAAPGGAAFTLTVNGANFVPTSQVSWGATPLATIFVSSAKLTAAVPATLIASTGTGWITVHNPPQAGSSNTFYLPVQTSVPSLLYAQLSFAAGNGPSNVVEGDFNNDGKMDLAVTNLSDGSVSIFLGKGDGTFQAQAAVAVGFSSPFGMAVGDINHDGNLDLVVGEFQATGLAVLLGKGDGTFQPPVVLPGDNSLLAPILADLNGDGNLDIISGVDGGTGIDVYLGNGDGSFQPVSVVGATLTDVSSVAAVDLNGDGNLDLVAVSFEEGNPNAGVDVLLGSGGGAFLDAVNYGPLASWNLVVGDFNQDGKIDVMTSAPEGAAPGFLFYAGVGDGTLSTPQNVGSGRIYSIAAGDLNGDGHLDVVGVDEDAAQLDVNLGNGDGTFQPAETFATNLGFAYSVVIGNFTTGSGVAIAVPDGNANLVVLEPAVVLSPANVNFGLQSIGLQTAATSITVTNSTSATVTLSAITFTGSNATDFSETDTCLVSSPQLAPGASCMVSVRFTPSVAGAESGTLNIIDNAPGSPQTVALAGTGAAPIVNLSAANLVFAASPVGTASATQSVTLTNAGTATLNLSSITLTGASAGDFSQSNNCGASVAPNVSCTITVNFTPTAAGSRTAAITISDNALDSPETVQLSGTGPDFALSFNTNFQSVAPGSTATFQLTVTPQDGFNGPITLTCADAPAIFPCTVTPSGLTLNGVPATASVALVANAQATAPPPSAGPWRGVPGGQLQVLVALAGLSLLLLVGSRRKPLPGRAATAQFACVLVGVITLAALGLAGCGYASHTATTTTSYNLTVTATSGTLSHQSSVTVTVQQ
jgi:hypothetical protein